MLPVSEAFYSFQGEGRTMGKRAVFLRLAGCNLMCGGQGTQFDKELHNGATWRCDTVEVWMQGQNKAKEQVLPLDCINAIRNGAHLIITGGEPMMQQKKIMDYIHYLRGVVGRTFYVEIETNGTIAPEPAFNQLVDQYNISPKLSNSGNELSARYKWDALKEFMKLGRATWKFVVSRPKDWHEIEELFLPFIDREKIWLMPAGENQELLNKNKKTVAELALKNHVNFSDRLHIEVWNQKTGV